MFGRVHQINISSGGVPKLSIPRGEVTPTGIIGDRQNDKKHHGGPMRAVCLFSLEVIQRLQGEGHTIEPGTTGENVTIAGIDWTGIVPGCTFVFDGGVELEVTSYAEPCSTIRDSFDGLEFKRIKHELHPGESRVYTKVVQTGVIEADEGVRVLA